MPNLTTDSSKTADGRGVGVKNRENFADVLNGWSQRAFEDYPEYQLVITGHSLGRGAAVWAAMTFLSGKTSLDPKKIKIKVGSKMTSWSFRFCF